MTCHWDLFLSTVQRYGVFPHRNTFPFVFVSIGSIVCSDSRLVVWEARLMSYASLV